jgi:acetyl esterase/lipase
MPIGSVVMVFLVGLCTLLALRPMRSPRRLAMLSFGFGVVVNELPQLALLLVAWSTWDVARDDELGGTPFGWFVTAVAGLTVVGLVVIGLRAKTAELVVDEAVAEELGGMTAGRRRRLRWLAALFTPFPIRGWNVQRIADVRYGEHGRFNQLDVYRLRSGPTGGPVLVYLHGGGYFSGHKHWEARALLHRLAARGWVCISANYRLRPSAGFMDHMVDAKKVLAWAHEHAHEYGGDASWLFMAGSSAGGHMTTLAALTPNDPVFQPGFEEADTSVTAAIGLYGYYGRYYGRPEDERPASTPLAYDARQAPPFFIAAGDQDTYVGVEGARQLAAKLRRESSQPVVYAELPGAQHGFDLFRSIRFLAVLDGIQGFTQWVRAREPETL